MPAVWPMSPLISPSSFGIKAHSTRSVVACKAFLAGVPMQDICNAAGWSVTNISDGAPLKERLYSCSYDFVARNSSELSVLQGETLEASEVKLMYPDWALAMLSLLIIIAVLPVPLGYAHSVLRQRSSQSALNTEAGYAPCSTTDTDSAPLSTQLNGELNPTSSPLAEEGYRLLPLTGEEEGEESTRV
ncbi:hypothetical protein PDJAM_G00011860 [Pangasius djambal]|uniref:Uncharacterized protein n=1 Tax=Pangasius djambal TaxID=1691987 RepID=A0ACC5Y0D6_9TELE|nr:hypothetical protein [Pangasius djambal]